MVEWPDNGALPPELGEVAYETLFQVFSLLEFHQNWNMITSYQDLRMDIFFISREFVLSLILQLSMMPCSIFPIDSWQAFILGLCCVHPFAGSGNIHVKSSCGGSTEGMYVWNCPNPSWSQFDYCHLKFFDCIMKCPNQKINMQHRMTVVLIKLCNGSRVATDAKRG